jgi:hypothetical protein
LAGSSFVRSDHMQNMAMEGWPAYWQGFPPFLNGTHALSPVVSIIGKRPVSVIAHGSGRLSAARANNHGCPFAVITATFRFEDSDVIAESTRCINETSGNAERDSMCTERYLPSNGNRSSMTAM